MAKKSIFKSQAYIGYRVAGDGLTFCLEMDKYCCIKSVRPRDRVKGPIKNDITAQMACLHHFPTLVTICHYFLLHPTPYVSAQKVTNLFSERQTIKYIFIWYFYNAAHHKLNLKQMAEEIKKQNIRVSMY